MFRSRLIVALFLAATLLFAVGSSDAAKVKVWQQQLQSHFDKAHFKQALVTSEGALRLSHQVKTLANLQAMNVWDIIEDKSGNLYAATGNEGKLWRVAPDGKTTLLYSSSESQILCLAQRRMEVFMPAPALPAKSFVSRRKVPVSSAKALIRMFGAWFTIQSPNPFLPAPGRRGGFIV